MSPPAANRSANAPITLYYPKSPCKKGYPNTDGADNVLLANRFAAMVPRCAADWASSVRRVRRARPALYYPILPCKKGVLCHKWREYHLIVNRFAAWRFRCAADWASTVRRVRRARPGEIRRATATVPVTSRSIPPQWGSTRFRLPPPHVHPPSWGVHRTCGEPDETTTNTHPGHITSLFHLSFT